MIKVRTQSEFDSIVAETPNTEMIAIYALPDGESYKLSRKWIIKSESYIKGINMPIIEWIGDVGLGVTEDMIECRGENTILVAKNIVIDGLHLKGKTGMSGHIGGIYARDCGYCVYSHTTSSYTSSYRGTSASATIGITIRNSKLENFSATGIYMYFCAYSTVVNNTFINCFGGNYFEIVRNSIFSRNRHIGGADFRFDNASTNVISCNEIINNNGGLYIDAGYSNVVQGNKISNCDYGAITFIDGSDNSITDNMIANNELDGRQAGIDLYNCWGNSIHGNTVINGNGHGISLKENSNRNTITGNTCMYNSGTGIINTTSTYNTFYGNISSNNGVNINVSGTGVLNNINMTTNHTG